MKYKAVIFDLFETLITEWGHKKYTKNELCSDLGIARENFDIFWNEKEAERYLGKVSFADSISYVCEKCGKHIDSLTIDYILCKRQKTKADCFEYINPDVISLLTELKSAGLRLAIVSNCSSEEVQVIKQSSIYPYFDEVILSYEVQMKKPDVAIYQKAADLLEVFPSECLFIGDGGSNELEGAKNAAMHPIQAKWYTNLHPHKRESIPNTPTAETTADILRLILSDCMVECAE